MPNYTTTEAAALLNTARQNVQKYCQAHKVRKVGRDYVISPKVLEDIRQSLSSIPADKPKVGRPKASREQSPGLLL